ncbi:50S ribosomal protein L29 [Cyclobacterium marinum]|uniref:Large ribosomal subunit protein uL29 n=1 Tax=Cyclobacterium marinum (strain ATCC 25205 / DSM 745 / LMG 13164 / NCIMB 1802) TaxID=880070 RepID=G0IXB1_CYCMS|nr:50S ribosomal protein L29 [Cyclobacterium marinum]AEL26336.1 ribosomal protein L29 [Cyclobacterium marinum DSM 745]MBI0399678.1 50S ribosomal protein L29 [Cyclobacterium marinum]MBR9774994.1 50S ribosomal protein L29 [Cytophagales bacterium]|tara:strand:+ start:812 stop:1006 length:195 start_codon:yes stop_codon:yes gene_type:complete
MKNSEINALNESELKSRIEAERENLTKLRFAHAISPIENPNRIRESRRLVARLNTFLRAKQLAK